jgi:hypothetical protein
MTRSANVKEELVVEQPARKGHMPKTNRSAYARNADVEHFRRKARSGIISEKAVLPLAIVFAASRNAQIAIGPGHSALDAIFESMHPAYSANWLKSKFKQKGRKND